MHQQPPAEQSSCPRDLGSSLTLLVDTVVRLSAVERLDDIVPIVLNAARRMTGADGVTFIIRDGDLCAYLEEDAIGPLWKGRRFPLSACVAGWSMLTGKTAIVPDISKDERIPQEAYRPTFVRSLVMVPVGEDRPVAAIGVYWSVAQEPGALSITLVEALARSAATALAGVARQQSLLKRVDELAALYRLTDRLYRAQTLAETYEAALDAILSALGCHRASILLFDEAGVMRFVAWRGLSDAYRKAVEGHSPWRPGDRDPQPIFIEDIEASDESAALKDTVKQEGIRALGFIPLAANGEVVGKFMTFYETPHVLLEDETDLAVTIARQVGFTLERMRAETARRAAEEELRRIEERMRLATRTGKVGLWDWDILSDRISWTDSLYAMHGVEKKSFPATVEAFKTLVHPGDRARVSEAVTSALEKDAPYELEFRALKSDGQVASLFTNATVLRENGRPVRMVGATFDVTDRKQAEERFRRAVEAAPSGMVLADSSGTILLVNAHAETLFGYSRDELVGQTIEILVPDRLRASHPEFRHGFGRQPSTRPMGAGRELFARRKDGSEVPVEIGLSPIWTNEGLLVLSAVVDISERKRAETQRELLLAELNHRVKNTLAVVQGLAQQTFRADGASLEARKAFEGRLAALAAAHDLLTRANWESSSLERIARDVLGLGSGDEQRIEVLGPRVLLRPAQALALAMALHELRTNAVKYGALSQESGGVVLEWQRYNGPEPRLRLEWREQNGPAVSPPKRRGFGSRMIEQALAQDLEGDVKLEFRPEGLVCTLDAPFPPERATA